MVELQAKLHKIYNGRGFTVSVPFCSTQTLRESDQFCVVVTDGRTISADQRKKIYATMRDISLWSGHEPDEIKAIAKYDFIAATGAAYFSLSDVDMTTANAFLDHLIAFCIAQGIPTLDNLLERSPDVGRYVYACLIAKTCCICGKQGKWQVQLHHIDHVGAGMDRKEIIHQGMEVISLCGSHHSEAHSLGKQSFCEKYKVFGIKADAKICEIYKLKQGG